MDLVLVIGYAAGSLTTLASLPQVLKTWKQKETRDISMLMFVFMTVGVLLWLAYGLFRHDMVLIVSNILTAILTSSMILMKLMYG